MRATHMLAGTWHIKQLATDRPDIAELMREAAAPDASWLVAPIFPAQIHDVLLAHGRIPDPHMSKNAAACAWVGDTDWAYACTFPTPAAPGDGGPAWLRFNGLDTLASAYLNGTFIGRFDDMFRQHSVNVREQLTAPGQPNLLLLIFSAPLRFVREVQQPAEHAGKIARHRYLRKGAGDFSSYLGTRPHFAKVGVYRDVLLDLPDPAGWLEDVCVRADLAPDHSTAVLHVLVEAMSTSATGAQLSWMLADPDGQAVAQGTADATAGGFTLTVDQPRLWWPWTHGTPHLYRLDVRLTLDGQQLDRRTRDVGIREITAMLSDPTTGEKRFAFAVNGRQLFLQGANWIPVEGMTHCWDAARARVLLDLAQHGRMNLLRVWGGGYEPPQEFYDECDRRGLLVWQDFFFEYGMYPSGEPAFDENCRQEAEGMVRRLRNHPCLLLWCGGNENYMGWDFLIGGTPTIGRDLYERILPDACAQLDPTRLFHPNSPFGGRAPNWPLEGDWHDYATLTFTHQSSVPTFISELGRVSAMSPANMQRFLTEEEFWPAGHDPAVRTPGQAAWPSMWQYRSVDDSWDKVGALEEFCDPASGEDLIRVLGTAHGEYLQHSVERCRRGVPDGAPDGQRRCGGTMVWRLNDAWPILYWSVVDYFLEPKIAFYFLRRAYTPLLVSFERTSDRLAVWVVNDSGEDVRGTLRVQRRRFDGTVRGELWAEVDVAPGRARRCLETVDLGPISLRDEFLHASFGGQETACLLKGERYLHLPRATLQAQVVGDSLDVSTDSFARQVALELEGTSDALFEDNFFDLMPGERRRIHLRGAVAQRRVSVRALNADPIRLDLSDAGQAAG